MKPTKPEAEASAWFSHRAEVAFIELRSQMRVRHLTQQELADRVTEAYGGDRRITDKNVSSWFRGFVPAIGVIEAYASACGVDPGWLAFGEGSAAPMIRVIPSAGHEDETGSGGAADDPAARAEDLSDGRRG
jgi:transcriptional regulator with XRE-family HTH domain